MLVWRVPADTLTVVRGGMKLREYRPHEAFIVGVLYVDDRLLGRDIAWQLHVWTSTQGNVRNRNNIERQQWKKNPT